MGNSQGLRHQPGTTTSAFSWTWLLWLYGPRKIIIVSFDNECVHAAKPAEPEITDQVSMELDILKSKTGVKAKHCLLEAALSLENDHSLCTIPVHTASLGSLPFGPIM